MVYAQPESVLHNIFWDFEIQTDHLITVIRPDQVLINKKKRTCQLVYIAVLVDQRVKFNEKISKFLDLA